MKVVTPYRPFPPESGAHQALGPFDWVGAIGMLRTTVRTACGCETYALTDVDTVLPGPTYAYSTQARRLMVWLLEVALCYLTSADFDDDTILISPDTLVFGDLRTYFLADLGVIVRTGEKYRDKPLLNGVQVWRREARGRLIWFYAAALDRARELPEPLLKWGADTTPLVELLAPLAAGPMQRQGLTVHGFEADRTFRPMSNVEIASLDHGRRVRPTVPIVDFKGQRKRRMAAYFAATREASCA